MRSLIDMNEVIGFFNLNEEKRLTPECESAGLTVIDRRTMQKVHIPSAELSKLWEALNEFYRPPKVANG